jgi:hypothetical protein
MLWCFKDQPPLLDDDVYDDEARDFIRENVDQQHTEEFVCYIKMVKIGAIVSLSLPRDVKPTTFKIEMINSSGFSRLLFNYKVHEIISKGLLRENISITGSENMSQEEYVNAFNTKFNITSTKESKIFFRRQESVETVRFILSLLKYFDDNHLT